MIGFGGVLPFVHRSVVERNRWLSDVEFAEMLSLCQVLPGANIVNLSVMLGYRFAGVRGAIASATGLLLLPGLVLLVIALLYAQVGAYEPVRRALRGMAAASAGLVIATGLRLYKAQPASMRMSTMVLLAFAAVAFFHIKLALVIGVLAPCAVLMEWASRRRSASARGDQSDTATERQG